MKSIRTLLVDDSPEFIEAARLFLSSDNQIEIVGYALSGEDAIKQVERLSPDLVLMDLAMPCMSGLDATREIKSSPTSPRVIILTLHDNLEYRTASRAVHSDGFVTKSEFGNLLLPQIYALFEEQKVAP
jgi:DNA-binding NarL/FixJ family response regulator